jgi:hypothetical protein
MIDIIYKGNDPVIINNITFIKDNIIKINENQLKELRNYSYFKDREQKIFLVVKKEITPTKTEIIEKDTEKNIIDFVEQTQEEKTIIEDVNIIQEEKQETIEETIEEENKTEIIETVEIAQEEQPQEEVRNNRRRRNGNKEKQDTSKSE